MSGERIIDWISSDLSLSEGGVRNTVVMLSSGMLFLLYQDTEKKKQAILQKLT